MPGPISNTELMTNKRPWFRLHLSTGLLLIPLAAGIAVLILPGAIALPPDAPEARSRWLSAKTDALEHGWPWTFLHREPAVDRDSLPTPAWLATSAWLATNDPATPGEWNRLALTGDVLVALGTLLVVAGILEWRRRRRASVWQFSLVELAVGILLVAIPCGWWQWNVRQYDREQQALDPLQRRYDLFGIEMSETSSESPYCGPLWLPRLIGFRPYRPFERTTELSLRYWRFAEPPAALAHLSYLHSITVYGVSNADSLAQWLHQMPRVQELIVGTMFLDDEGLATLCRTGRLVELVNVSGTRNKKLTDTGIAHLATLPRLRSADLSHTQVTDAGIARLAELPALETLVLDNTTISDEGLTQIARMGRLKWLTLSHTRVSNAGIAALAKLAQLETLDVGNTDVNTDCVPVLQSMRGLKQLTLPRVSRPPKRRFTPAAVFALQDALPGCKIDLR